MLMNLVAWNIFLFKLIDTSVLVVLEPITQLTKKMFHVLSIAIY